jgi:hypothetical protein
MIAEVLAGGPMTTFNTDGSYISANPIRFRVKAYNADGWQAAWAEFTVDDDTLPVLEEITATGSLLTVYWDEPVYLNDLADPPTLSISATLGAAVATYASGAGTDQWLFTLSRIITLGEVATASWEYVADSIETISGDDLPAFTNFPVANESVDTTCFFFGPNFSPRTAFVGKAFTLNTGARFRNAVSYANLSLDALPDGLSFSTETGLISGTAEVADQTATVEVEGTGSGAETAASNVFSISTAVFVPQAGGVVQDSFKAPVQDAIKEVIQ